MNKLRKWIDSIVFAGLKPGDPRASEPLYLSNRTTAQKIKAWSVVAIPMIILVGGVALSLSSYLRPPVRKPAAEPSPAEVAGKMLPDLKDFKLESTQAVDVVEIRVEKSGGLRLVGTVRNKTARAIASGELGCDLTDADGTQLGSVTVHLEDIGPSAVKRFETPIKSPNASFVLVRSIATH
jgi:hypothetical protein